MLKNAHEGKNSCHLSGMKILNNSSSGFIFSVCFFPTLSYSYYIFLIAIKIYFGERSKKEILVGLPPSSCPFNEMFPHIYNIQSTAEYLSSFGYPLLK